METTRPAQAARRSDGRCNSMVGRVDKERVDEKHVGELFFLEVQEIQISAMTVMAVIQSEGQLVLVHAGLEGPRSTFARRFTTVHDKRDL